MLVHDPSISCPGPSVPVQVKSLAPDETIKMTFADYTARRDPAFERAVALAGIPLSGSS